MPEHVRRYGDGWRELKPRGSNDDGNAKEDKRIARGGWEFGGRGRGRRRCKVLDGISFLLLEQSLWEWPSFSEEIGENGGTVVKDIYSIRTFEPLHNLHLGVQDF